MNQFQPRHYMWRYWAMGLVVFVATAGAPSRGKRQPAPRQGHPRTPMPH